MSLDYVKVFASIPSLTATPEEEEEYKKSIEIGPRAIVVLLGRQEAEKDAIMAPVAALQDHHEA